MANPSAPTRRPITADSALMNPASRIIALKAAVAGGSGGDSLQIFNLDTKAKVKSFQIAQPVAFWKWVSPGKLGIVTASAVYHWDLEGAGDPVKVFDRAANLEGSQIISYRVSDDGAWCVLVGIAPGTPDRPALVKGFMQLFSVAQARSQALEAHAAAFATVTPPGASSPIPVIAFAQKTAGPGGAVTSKLHIVQLGTPPPPPGGGAAPPPLKKAAELFFPPEFADDFPVAMQASPRFGLAYVATKAGLLFVYDLASGAAVYRNRVSPDPVFLTAPDSPSSGGLYLVNRRGQVLHATVNEAAMVPFVAGQLKNVDLALALASRGNLPGAEPLAAAHFDKLFAAGDFKGAAEAAAASPQGALRTRATVDRFKAVPAPPGQPSPLLVYFGTLLQRGGLNELESAELAALVLAQGKKHLLDAWLKEGKLAPSEALGDALRGAGDADAALGVYRAAGAAGRVIEVLASKGDFAELTAYAGSAAGGAGGAAGGPPNYVALLQRLCMDNPDAAVALAKQAVKQPGPPLEVAAAADIFLQRNMVREATAFLLDALAGDDPAQAALQTKLLEVNLVSNPAVADAIMGSGQLSHYDRPRIAQLAEKAGLPLRALQHYADLADIKRVVVGAPPAGVDPAALVEFCGTLSADWALECLSALLAADPAGNLPLCVQIAKEYTDQLGSARVIKLFEDADCWPGLYFYLGSLVAFSTDPDVHFKYIEAAAKTGNVAEVERLTRESDVYPPEATKQFLMDARLPDARPLINVCDRHGMVADLTAFLWASGQQKYIEAYIQKVNPSAAPAVVGALLDADAPEDFIANLILSVRSLVPVDALCEAVEARNRLKLLAPFLEQLVSEGSHDPGVHSSLGKVVVDGGGGGGNNPEHFLTTNPYYDSRVVGKYCEKRDPHLACIAYRRGQCDAELVDCTTRHALFKVQARYVVERADGGLWATVLDGGNPARRSLVDQVVSTALPECRNPEQVSVAVKAFMAAGLQSELIELLEKIVLQNSAFAGNHNLQNLLIITAIKADQRDRVRDYIARLDNFDGPAVGEIAVGYDMPDAAFDIYKKFGLKAQAVKVLLDQGGGEKGGEKGEGGATPPSGPASAAALARAAEYAAKADDPAVWAELGGAQLDAGAPADAIESFLKAGDASRLGDVVAAASAAGEHAALVKFLRMARAGGAKAGGAVPTTPRGDARVDTELACALAGAGDQAGLEAFLAGPNQANLGAAGDRLFEGGHFEAARAVFARIPNWGRLASAHLKLGRWQDAVDAARKAAVPKVWKAVCYACLDAGEAKLAQLAGLAVVVNADDLDEVSRAYLDRGRADELIALLESGIGLDRAHMGIFTELGILYARHRPEKLMEHLKLFAARLNVPRLIRVCEEAHLWKELVFLYIAYDEPDNAARVMMAHAPVAWEHVLFKDVAVKVADANVYYAAVSFYLESHPDLLVDLLKVLEARVDHARVVGVLRSAGHLALAKDYLLAVQKADIPAVNDAVNELLVESGDAEGLAESVRTYTNFDALALAAALKAHPSPAFRRVAAGIFRAQGKWGLAVDMAVADGAPKDAIAAAAASGDAATAERLLRHFVEAGEKECFGAALLACYPLVPPDVALELAWAHGLTDVAMPFLIQALRDQAASIKLLMADRDAARAARAASGGGAGKDSAAYLNMMPLALPPASGGGGGGGGGPAF
jgi:clathrin heavy chain